MKSETYSGVMKYSVSSVASVVNPNGDGNGVIVQKYINGPKVDEVLVKVSTTGSVYYRQDGLGSMTLRATKAK